VLPHLLYDYCDEIQLQMKIQLQMSMMGSTDRTRAGGRLNPSEHAAGSTKPRRDAWRARCSSHVDVFSNPDGADAKEIDYGRTVRNLRAELEAAQSSIAH
jgi:hypothetical protein